MRWDRKNAVDGGQGHRSILSGLLLRTLLLVDVLDVIDVIDVIDLREWLWMWIPKCIWWFFHVGERRQQL